LKIITKNLEISTKFEKQIIKFNEDIKKSKEELQDLKIEEKRIKKEKKEFDNKEAIGKNILVPQFRNLLILRKKRYHTNLNLLSFHKVLLGYC